MPYLEQEKIRIQAEVQADAAEIAGLTAQLATQQQAVETAQALVTSAQSSVTDAQAQVSALNAAAMAADQKVSTLDQQIANHEANEPDRFLDGEDLFAGSPARIPLGSRPRPNPEWRIWKRVLDQLIQEREQAHANAIAAHAQFSQGQVAVSQAQAGVQAAERQVSEATATVQATQFAITSVRQHQIALEQQVADLEHWQTEIARDPLDRAVLERVATELSARALAAEEALTMTQFEQEDAQQRLAALVARQEQLIPLLNEVNGQLPAAQAELQAAQGAFVVATRNVEAHVRRGP
jgi:chromosome segregation ATPase